MFRLELCMKAAVENVGNVLPLSRDQCHIYTKLPH